MRCSKRAQARHYVIVFENLRFRPSIRINTKTAFSKTSTLEIVFQNLRFQKYPDTCGRGPTPIMWDLCIVATLQWTVYCGESNRMLTNLLAATRNFHLLHLVDLKHNRIKPLITWRAKLLEPDWLMRRAFFLNSGGKITWPWLAKFSECFCVHLISCRTNGFLAVFVACEG